VIVDRQKCAGLAICESISPDHFEIDDDGELAVVNDEISDQNQEKLEQAVRGCPNAALRLAAARES